jgi:hypothetical protein
VSERLVGFTNSRGVADRLLYSAFEADGAGVLGSGRSGSLGIDDASAHVASTFLITSAGSDAGDEGSAGVAGAFAKSAASGAKGIDDGSAGVAGVASARSGRCRRRYKRIAGAPVQPPVREE